MKMRSLVVPTIFLRAVTVLIGAGVLALMLWEPHIEGRNAHATLFEIYFKDPFLAYAYLASTPFFVALYQAFMVLGYIVQVGKAPAAFVFVAGSCGWRPMAQRKALTMKELSFAFMESFLMSFTRRR